MIVARTFRASAETTATSSTSTARRSSHLRTSRPGCGSPRAISALTSRATVVWSAVPGTIRMMKVDMSALNEP